MNADWEDQLARNVSAVRQRIAVAAERAGRSPDEVRLVAVTKYAPAEVLGILPRLGVHDVGESRILQLAARAAEVGGAVMGWDGPAGENDVRWHMIGHVQRNKIRSLLPHARVVHSLDSVRLADALGRQALTNEIDVDVFIELNVAGEESKQGAPVERLDELVVAVYEHDRLRLRGLMTMAPYDPDPEHARPVFARLHELLASLHDRGCIDEHCRHLSMGMSQDYAVAVEEGATCVRVGSVLFEGLPTADPRGA